MANPRTIARLASRIQQRVAYCLQFELNDPRADFVTVTQVELSSDLRNAKIFWSTIGGPGERSRTEHMLEHATGFVRRQLGRVLETRVIPELRWVYDESIERAVELDRLIREARTRDEAIRAQAQARGHAPHDPAAHAGEDRASQDGAQAAD